MRRSAAGAALLAAVFLAACDSGPEVRRQQHFVLGTVVTIEAVGVSQAEFREGTGAAFRAMRELHQALEPGVPDNALGRFNAAAEGSWRPVPPPLDKLLPRSLAVRRASGGTFDPTLGRLIGLWGFRSPPFPDTPPEPTAIRELRAHGAGRGAIALRRTASGLEARMQGPAAALDLGGIAKGYALDRAAAVLREHGVTNALIDAGGDLLALGRRGERRWRVGIRKPRGQSAVAVIALRAGEAVVTSGDYERFFVHEGTRYHHLLDPATGYPARRARAATVVGPNATAADAWSTALFVSGRAGLQRLGSWGGLVIDGEGRAHANAVLGPRLEWRGSRAAPSVEGGH